MDTESEEKRDFNNKAQCEATYAATILLWAID